MWYLQALVNMQQFPDGEDMEDIKYRNECFLYRRGYQCSL